jgi:hypothetical protein
MTLKEIHLANKRVLDLTHDEAKCFLDITDARAISGEVIQFILVSQSQREKVSICVEV